MRISAVSRDRSNDRSIDRPDWGSVLAVQPLRVWKYLVMSSDEDLEGPYPRPMAETRGRIDPQALVPGQVGTERQGQNIRYYTRSRPSCNKKQSINKVLILTWRMYQGMLAPLITGTHGAGAVVSIQGPQGSSPPPRQQKTWLTLLKSKWWWDFLPTNKCCPHYHMHAVLWDM